MNKEDDGRDVKKAQPLGNDLFSIRGMNIKKGCTDVQPF